MKRSLSEKITRAAVGKRRLIKTTWRYIIQKWKTFLRYINPEIWIMNCSRKWICQRTPIIANKIFFQTFQGDYTCNPKYITEALLKKNKNLDIVWSLRESSLINCETLPPQVRVVEQFSLEYFKEIASAKIWVVNSVEFLKKEIIKKPDQILFETWHGSLGIKRFSKDVNAGKAWVKAAEKCGKWTNYCISNSTFEDNVYRGTFWPDSEILRYGHPRNDILISVDKDKLFEIREKLWEIFNIPMDNKLILYAPTFRDDHQFKCYNVNAPQLLKAVKEKFGGEWTFLTRYHPTVRKWAQKRGHAFFQETVDVTTYDDIQELIAVTDIAITDYSSWIYDFVLTGRPGFIYATDIEKYYSERGFYYPLNSTPFPVVINNSELIKAVKDFNMESYSEKVHSFLADKGCMEDGNASIRVADKIVEVINSLPNETLYNKE